VPANRWLRFAIPFLTIFGGGFVLRLLFSRRDEPGLHLYGGIAALAVVSLVIGLIKERKAHRDRIPDAEISPTPKLMT